MAHPWVPHFLAQLAKNGCISKSALAVGVTSSTVYALRRSDADFAAAMEHAIEDSTDILELEARRRAVDGVRKPVVYKGELTPIWKRDAHGEIVTQPQVRYKEDGTEYTVELPVQATDEDGNPAYLTVTEYSDALLAMLLKGNRRSKYGDRQEITGLNGGPVQIDEKQRTSRIAALLGLAQMRKDIG